MRRSALSLTLVAAVLGLTGCYHARVETGLAPGTQVIDKPWALSFIGGLIPPPAVNAAADCPGGVAVVETEHSILNSIVAGITFGIITPVHITVTCAAGNTGALRAPHGQMTVEGAAGTERVAEAIQQAAEVAARDDHPVVVRFAD